ncbi:Clp protease N-terminal domain-containing protein [Noviherbaspirillum aerium]|uniref:Clp protease N-terminal domain-containing protein n=1 Tax=Noviherbaspirillum aerium TaxID=2588497 RepID=UPI00178C362C|nr:Clp protease N-terminal domain-containing protein [Noviherbaspirillum aerium]
MFRMLKQRINDIRTINSLCLSAERHANADGEKEPGLEHFVLAALDLPDCTARKAFERLGADPDGFRAAVAAHYRNALKSVGVDTPEQMISYGAAGDIPPGNGLYRSKHQVKEFMQRLANRKMKDGARPLLGAHVLETAAGFEHGVASRTFATMGIHRQAMGEAARAEAEKEGQREAESA